MSKLPTWQLFLMSFFIGIGVGIAAIIMWNIIVPPPPPPSPAYPLQYYPKESFVIPTDIKKQKETVATASPLFLPIIMYHYVEGIKDVNDKIRNGLTINPYLFEAQLKTLADNNYKTYFVKEIPGLLKDPKAVASRSAVLTFDDGYEDFYSVVAPLLEKYKVKGTVYVINDFVDRRNFLTTQELKELAKNPYVEIGSHTLDHVYLKGMAKEIATRQIIESKKQLEKTIGRPVRTFAYPYGAFDQQAIDIVKNATFSAAVSVIPGSHHTKDSLYYLFRIRAGRLGSGEYMIEFLENQKHEASVSAQPLTYP